MDMKAMMAEQMEEMLRDKYIESEKAGHDLGEPRMVQWTKEHAVAFRREYYRKHLMDLGNGEKPHYFGIFLDCASKKELIDILLDGIPNGWIAYGTMATIIRGDVYQNPEIVNFLAENLGNTVDLDVVSLGISPTALAVGVSGMFKSVDNPPYILLATATETDISDEFSISNWKKFELTKPLHGVVDAFPSHFGWKH